MKLKLTNDDRSAIDLLLDQAAAAVETPSRHYVAASGREHLNAVEKVLKLLQVLPVSEPPVDLVSRTLAHISRVTGQALAGQISETNVAGNLTHRQAHRPA